MTSTERLDDLPGRLPARSLPDGRLPDGAGPSDDLAAATARLHAWHAVADGPTTGTGAGEAGRDGTGQDDPGLNGGGSDELADRLRARRSAARSARHVAAAYSAAHGHPWDGDADARGGSPRWGLGLRTAVVASVVLLVLALGASVVAFLQPDDVVTLAGAAREPAAGDAPAGPDAEDGGEADGGESDGGEASGGAGTTGDDAPADAAASGPAGAGAEDPGPRVLVHVVGEVREPGLVTVPPDARVADAVEAAGGPTREADTAAVNLARAVVDGEQIVVPAPGEAPPAPAAGAGEASAGSSAGPGGVVDLNAAAASDLDALPGIGPVLAERVVAWRDENGPFTSVDELEEVSGIGPSVLEQVRDMVRV